MSFCNGVSKDGLECRNIRRQTRSVPNKLIPLFLKTDTSDDYGP
jgi:hypothetical protein